MGKHTTRPLLPLFSYFFVFSIPLFLPSRAEDTVDGVRSVRNGETLVSAGGSFVLGFYSIGGGSTKRYLCIRSTKGQEQPIVWVANRGRALNDSGGILRFGGDGNLVVLDNSGGTVWSTGLPPTANTSRVAKLLESGNLVVRDTGDDLSGRFLWQSFDVPGNTLLPGMKILLNTRSGASRHLTSWKSADDPSAGNYSYRMEVDKLPRLVILEGSKVRFSTGPWVGARFAGTPSYNANGVFNASVVFSGDEVYFTDNMIANSSLATVVLEPSGTLRRTVWDGETRSWGTLWKAPTTCEVFASCGPFGVCTDGTFPYCRCPRGFHPWSPREWNLGNTANGCVRNNTLDCDGTDGFLPLVQIRLPELKNAAVDMGMSLEECRERCAGDCSCTAYARADFREEGRGCITWSGGLVNTKAFSNDNHGQQLYLKVSASDREVQSGMHTDSHKNRRKKLAIVVSLSVVSGIVLLILCGLRFWINDQKKLKETQRGRRTHHTDESVHEEDTDLPLFDFETIASATNNFSLENKVGEGGFGTVFKGTLYDGQEIAVKRLRGTSVQGLNEFMNEVKLIVKLQHKNLVRLLGCCVRREEKMLIYEYMENKSLDLFIFEDKKCGELNWRMRLDIILGVARGLLYLHHDSRFKIIHRDLKTANILLDGAMNPKISDFGTARIFGADQQTEKTKRVVGTFGYMSPEYAINGIISIKSDVFSFGVLVLEVLSGIKHRGIYVDPPHVDLLSHAWMLWQEGQGLGILDPTAAGARPETELLRCVQVGLLCVQELAVDRPTILEVVMMLGSENFPLPLPKQPGFSAFRSPHSSSEFPSRQQESSSTNDLTITTLSEGR